MRREHIVELGTALSRARRLGRLCSADLRSIPSMEDARRVQDAAIAHYGGQVCGYTLAASFADAACRLNCFRPLVGRLPDEHDLDAGARLQLPHAALGVGPEFVFRVGAPLPNPVALQSVHDAIVCCHVGLQLLGRRVSHSPLNEWSATADFGLDAACVRGPRIEGWEGLTFAGVEGRLELNSAVVATRGGEDALAASIAAVHWLARDLQERGMELLPGDVVAAGSFMGLTQIVPGQRVRASFGRFGEVDLHVE